MLACQARKASGTVLFIAALAALTGCDAGKYLPGESAAPAPAAVAREPETTQTSWAFSGGDLQGWVVNIPEAVVAWPETGGLSLTAPAEPAAPDLVIRSPIIAIAGSDYSSLTVDLEAVVPAADLDLALYYSTTVHGEGYEYRGAPSDGAPLSAGERRVLVYDMSNPPAGGTDWVDSTIQQIRFDLPQGANSNYIVHSIKLCPTEAADCG